jgi:hypothetical protein
MSSQEHKKFMEWLIRCEAIAGSASYVVNGYPEAQVSTLKGTLRQAAEDGTDWRRIYECIYESWHTRRPHFPDLNAMAALIEQDRST